MAIAEVRVYEPASSASTRSVAVDTVASREYQVVKLAWGASGTATLVEAAAPLPVTLVAADLAALETINAAQSGTWNIGTVTAVTAITNALPAGTNAIGKLAANSGVDIGDVDVLSSALPTGAATSALQGGGLPAALGQGTMAQGLRVVLPSDQTVNVNLATALASGTDSVAAVQSGTWNVTNVSGTVSLPTGAATAALQGGGLPAALGPGLGLKIEGNVANAAADAGNPVGIGGLVRSSAAAGLTALTRQIVALNNGGELALGWGGSSVSTGSTNNPAVLKDYAGTARPLAVVPMIHTGSTYERFLGDTTLGVYAQPKKAATALNSPTLGSDFGTITKANLKGATGNVFAVTAHNANAAARFLLLHNKATAPVATDVPLYAFYLPPLATITIGETFFGLSGKNFTTGIGWSISTTSATFTDSATNTEHAVHVHYI